MNVLKKITAMTSIFLLMITTLLQVYTTNFSSTEIETANTNKSVKVSVLFNNYDINFLKLLTEDMKKIERENLGIVQYNFYDGKGNQNVQDNQLKDILSKQNADIIVIDMVDVAHTQYVIDRIKECNIPVIVIYNGDEEAVKSYEKAFLARTNPAEVGTLEGTIIVDSWNKNKKSIDKNQDDILEYIILIGSPINIVSINRAKYCVLAINNSNIKNKEIAEKFCYWNPEQTKEAVEQFILRFGNKIEAIITDDDGVAVETVKTLQKYGYNLGNNENNIVVVGCDGISKALDLIKKGTMTGTVIINPYNVAKDLYTFEMNIVNNKNIIDGTNCTIDNSRKLITIPLDGVFANLN